MVLQIVKLVFLPQFVEHVIVVIPSILKDNVLTNVLLVIVLYALEVLLVLPVMQVTSLLLLILSNVLLVMLLDAYSVPVLMIYALSVNN